MPFSLVRLERYRNVILMALALTLVVHQSVASASPVELTSFDLAGVVGAGDKCDFAAGVLAGLGVAGLAFCVVCGVVSGVGTIVHLYVC